GPHAMFADEIRPCLAPDVFYSEPSNQPPIRLEGVPLNAVDHEGIEVGCIRARPAPGLAASAAIASDLVRAEAPRSAFHRPVGGGWRAAPGARAPAGCNKV